MRLPSEKTAYMELGLGLIAGIVTAIQFRTIRKKARDTEEEVHASYDLSDEDLAEELGLE